MDWRIKCLAFYAMNKRLYDFAQKRLTGRYFATITDEELRAYQFHIDNFKASGARTALEIGAGRNLLCSLLLSRAGAKVFAYDLNRLATVEQVNGVIDQLRERLGGDWPALSTLDDLWKYSIDYRAPADARSTGLTQVDFICSTSTLEHIPQEDLKKIHAECVRLKPRLVSHIVDYHDHYASFDKSISMTNFYRYGEARWKLWNPPKHYQNRLRHSDQIALLQEAGLQVVSDRRVVWNVKHPPLAAPFLRYSSEDLSTLNGFTALKPIARS
jgi:hypothetical protein